MRAYRCTVVERQAVEYEIRFGKCVCIHNPKPWDNIVVVASMILANWFSNHILAVFAFRYSILAHKYYIFFGVFFFYLPFLVADNQKICQHTTIEYKAMQIHIRWFQRYMSVVGIGIRMQTNIEYYRNIEYNVVAFHVNQMWKLVCVSIQYTMRYIPMHIT